jgi:hypothetical protein
MRMTYNDVIEPMGIGQITTNTYNITVEACYVYQDLGHDCQLSFGGFSAAHGFSSSHAGEGKAPSSEALKNIGPALAKAYTFEPVHPAPPDHLWLTAL